MSFARSIPSRGLFARRASPSSQDRLVSTQLPNESKMPRARRESLGRLSLFWFKLHLRNWEVGLSQAVLHSGPACRMLLKCST